MSHHDYNIDRDDLVRMLRELVRIDSRNPALEEGAPGEGRIAAHVAGEMRRAGLEVESVETGEGRVSVAAGLPDLPPAPGESDSRAGRSLALNAHTDTVGVEGMEEPFSGELREGRVWGRGAYDMKGSLAACMAAAKALAEAGLPERGRVLVAAVADEEYRSAGTAGLLEDPRFVTDGAVVTEPTGLKACLAHKGFAWLRVETRGRAAHGSNFAEGVDANLHMGRVLAGLDRLEREVRAREAHPRVGPPSLHAPLLRGGTGISTYSPSCALKVERRTVPGETGEQAEAEVRAILDRLAEEDPAFDARLETLLVRAPFETEPGAPVVRALEAAAKAVTGERPERTGESPWMDSALLAEAGVDTVVYGPAGAGAHAAEEWVEVESVVRLAEVLAGTAVRYCDGEEGE